jgi:GDP-L-fucose synthase
VDDMADACLFLMENYDCNKIGSFINIGTGEDLTIAELARIVKEIVGFNGEFIFNPDKPDGTPRKLLDVTRINDLGWKAMTPLEAGVRYTYGWYKGNNKQ